jgi:hypothetical protein
MLTTWSSCKYFSLRKLFCLIEKSHKSVKSCNVVMSWGFLLIAINWIAHVAIEGFDENVGKQR